MIDAARALGVADCSTSACAPGPSGLTAFFRSLPVPTAAAPAPAPPLEDFLAPTVFPPSEEALPAVELVLLLLLLLLLVSSAPAELRASTAAAFVDFFAPDPAFFTASGPEERDVTLSLVIVRFDEGAPSPAVPVLVDLPVEAASLEFPDVLDASAPPTEPVR
ncbi:hypothetical protein ACH0BM_09225 [Kocuria rhizophila]|uniref:hypothetical protein n=1 Tax=Kocuria rhizophila TaxID=72000 RepID=UPI0021A685E5|nr:hypothetical protein [Kocuria rhizophila]MCT1917226.1 hypothetical protein [Kocuria rhizophila]